MSIQYIATTKEWFDRVNGVTYFSTQIENLKTGNITKVPFQNGYGNHAELLTKQIVGTLTDQVPVIKHIKINKCLKRDVVAHGE